MNPLAGNEPVAVIGAGAIGLSLASALARAVRPITVCGGRKPIDHIEITEAGTPETWPVRHATDPAAIAEHTTAIVAVKAHHTPAVADWMRALARPEATVLVAQNGVEHRDRVLPYVGPARTVPSVVYLNVERTAPGPPPSPSRSARRAASSSPSGARSSSTAWPGSGCRSPSRPTARSTSTSRSATPGLTSWQFCERALQEAHVALTPGRDFGVHTADSHVRLSYAASADELREGIARLGKFLATLE